MLKDRDHYIHVYCRSKRLQLFVSHPSLSSKCILADVLTAEMCPEHRGTWDLKRTLW